MPRFPEGSVAYLKRMMLIRAPLFRFSAGDVEDIVKETGLNQAQILVWAENFRMRYESEKERTDFLKTDGFEKRSSVKMTRFFVSCFNVTPEFLTNFKFKKSKGQGEFAIKYMEADFNKEAESGEFFFEFEENVWEHKLIESFQSQGAGQVNTITFAHNDGGDSAANALLRILSAQEKMGEHRRGSCPPALFAKVNAKRIEAEHQKQTSAQEFDEKTAAAIQQSLEAHTVKLDGIQHGGCNVIPDYQREIELLKTALAHKTAYCDTVEGKLAHKTRVLKQQDAFIIKLDSEQNPYAHDNINLCVYLKHALEQTQRTAELLSSTLAGDRAAKRQRV